MAQNWSRWCWRFGDRTAGIDSQSGGSRDQKLTTITVEVVSLVTRPQTPVDKMMSSISEPLALVVEAESSNTSCQCGVSSIEPPVRCLLLSNCRYRSSEWSLRTQECRNWSWSVVIDHRTVITSRQSGLFGHQTDNTSC